MNWLAHLYLSEPTSAFRIGNLLPDFLSVPALKDLSPDFSSGIECHRRIDLFTDSHPIVRRSVGRFAPPYRRFGGILTDIFYDHFLAREWDLHSKIPLPDFAEQVYQDFAIHRPDLPGELNARFEQMKNDNWLCSYRELSGIGESLRRTGMRLRQPNSLASSISILEQDYDLFYSDFKIFFPELVAHVSQQNANKKT